MTDLANEGKGGVPALFKSFTAQAGLDYEVSLETRGGSRQLAEFFRGINPEVEMYLMATWSRAGQTYPATDTWSGKPIEAMTRDVRAAYDKAAAGPPGVKAVIPVGEA